MIAIYKITNRLNGKPYVGQTRQMIEKRFIQHSKDKTPLGNAMRQCGLENFILELIETCETQEQANEREKFWIKVLNCKVPNGYNQNNGGGGGGLRKPKTNEIYGVTEMKLGKIIHEYRQRNRISMGDFTKASGLSKPYVSMLEANKNSSSGKPINPSVETVAKVSVVVGIPLNKLLRKLNGEEIDLRQPEFSEEETELVDGYRGLNEECKRLIFGMIQQLNFRHMSAQDHHVAAV